MLLTSAIIAHPAPMFVKRLPRERTVSAGSSLELHCLVREATPEVISMTEYSTKGEWWKQQRKKMAPFDSKNCF